MSIKNKKTKPQKIAVVLMTYGSPATLDDIPEYLKRIYGGKDASGEVITEFRRRYDMIGGSPLVKITQEQATALEKELNKSGKQTFRVAAGMRFSHPFIEKVIKEIASDADQVIGIIMSPQYSPIIMSGYVKELKETVARLQKNDLKLTIAEDWHLQPYFIQALAERVQQAIDKHPEEVRKTLTVLFSAHSMPKKVIDKEPDYINHLKETAAAVAKLLNLKDDRWMFCYQSAGHTPEEWLKPDFVDIMPELEKAGKKHVIIAPVQFLADHLEILYDVGIGAKEQAEEHGIHFARTESLNTSPLFIKALASVVENLLQV
ncbi:MAG TPA: ferrochelatase [Candidatus Saccharimonadales bacterium]|nr:ferrochelatase [Candidatus Saccharimonadales bacterium]